MGKSQTFYKKPNFKYVLPQKCINSVNIDFVKQPYTQPTSVLFLFFFLLVLCIFGRYDCVWYVYTGLHQLHLPTLVYANLYRNALNPVNEVHIQLSFFLISL